MKIYTKRGDKGETSLIGGTRVPKDHLRIECYGTVDELNSYLGLLRDQAPAAQYKDFLKDIQDNLFTIGSHLASDPGKSRMQLPEITEAAVEALERSIDEIDGHLPDLRSFVLPGGHPANSIAHVARCVCRRAERLVVALSGDAPVEEVILAYLNRLSDWLFIFAREMTYVAGKEEVLWLPKKDE